MIRINDTLANDPIQFNCVENRNDLSEVINFMHTHTALGIDTESTGLNTYHPDWRLRTVQLGDAYVSYVIPAAWRRFIAWIMKQSINWIAHNGPHDIRSIDCFLGYETGVVCAGETYLPAHYADSRSAKDGGIGHGLKEQACARIDPTADKWEVELKRIFKTIRIPIMGEIYRSGKNKGMQKTRKARLDEGWALIDLMHPAYIAYAAADPILAYRLWSIFQPIIREFYQLYHFDKKVQQACDTLQRRAIRLDTRYTTRLSAKFEEMAAMAKHSAQGYGCSNIQSGLQLSATIQRLGGTLTACTPTGQYKTDDATLRALMADTPIVGLIDFIHQVLLAKQLVKRQESYTNSMLSEVDCDGRIHPSINTLGARTSRMSVSKPPLQQLPTKDRGEDEDSTT